MAELAPERGLAPCSYNNPSEKVYHLTNDKAGLGEAKWHLWPTSDLLPSKYTCFQVSSSLGRAGRAFNTATPVGQSLARIKGAKNFLYCGSKSCVYPPFFLSSSLFFTCSLRDLVPWLGIESGPPVFGVWSLSHWATKEVSNSVHFSFHQLISHLTNVYPGPRLWWAVYRCCV